MDDQENIAMANAAATEKARAKEDKRKVTSKDNASKARASRMGNISKKKQMEDEARMTDFIRKKFLSDGGGGGSKGKGKGEYSDDDDSSTSSDDSEEIVYINPDKKKSSEKSKSKIKKVIIDNGNSKEIEELKNTVSKLSEIIKSSGNKEEVKKSEPIDIPKEKEKEKDAYVDDIEYMKKLLRYKILHS